MTNKITKKAAAVPATAKKNNDFSSMIQKTLGGQSYIAEDMPETTIFYDTGAYILNAAISGSMYGGIPGDLIYAFAGEEATGKTFYLFSIIDNFLKRQSEGLVILFETEGAPVKENLRARGIDLSRIIVSKVATIEEFRTKALNITEAYKENKETRPIMMILDSLGMLSTSKEVGDVSSGKDVRDMTRNQLIRGTFRVLSMKLNELKIPLYMSNHTYQVIGAYFPTKEMAGGGGLKYAASGILSLAKSKERDEKSKEVTGNIIKVMVVKSRFTKEQKRVETLLRFDGGLDRYYGLLPIAEKYGIFKKKPKGYEMPDGSTAYEKNINKNPEKYYTAEVMALLEDACQKEFKFNRGAAGEALEEEVDDIIGAEVEKEEDMPQHDNDE